MGTSYINVYIIVSNSILLFEPLYESDRIKQFMMYSLYFIHIRQVSS